MNHKKSQTQINFYFDYKNETVDEVVLSCDNMGCHLVSFTCGSLKVLGSH